MKKIRLFRTNQNPKVRNLMINEIGEEIKDLIHGKIWKLSIFRYNSNHLEIQIIHHSLNVGNNQESFDRGMAGFSNQFHVVAMQNQSN